MRQPYSAAVSTFIARLWGKFFFKLCLLTHLTVFFWRNFASRLGVCVCVFNCCRYGRLASPPVVSRKLALLSSKLSRPSSGRVRGARLCDTRMLKKKLGQRNVLLSTHAETSSPRQEHASHRLDPTLTMSAVRAERAFNFCPSYGMLLL